MTDYRIRFCAVVREAANKQGSPYVGFSVPGQRPIAVRRKLLSAIVQDLPFANARIACSETYGPVLRIESLDGKRKYCLRSASDPREVRKEHHRFSAHKIASRCRQNGWVRKVTFTGDSVDPDGTTTVNQDGGTLVTAHEKAGLRIIGKVVYHAASGKPVLVASNQERAFVAAEKALAIYDSWEQDAESLLQALGPERRNRLQLLRTEISA